MIPLTYVFVKEAKAIAGIPDIIGNCNGRFFAIEVKRSLHEKPTMIQKYNLDCIDRSGGLALVAAPENFSEVLSEVYKLCPHGKEILKPLRDNKN